MDSSKSGASAGYYQRHRTFITLKVVALLILALAAVSMTFAGTFGALSLVGFEPSLAVKAILWYGVGFATSLLWVTNYRKKQSTPSFLRGAVALAALIGIGGPLAVLMHFDQPSPVNTLRS